MMRMHVGGFVCLIVTASVLLVGCETTPPAPPAVEKDYSRQLPPGAKALELVTDPAEYPDFAKMWGERSATILAIDRSLAYLEKPSSHNYYPYEQITHERCVSSLLALKEILQTAKSAEEMKGFIHLYYDVYRSVGWDGSGEVLFTAYFTPIFRGSKTKTAEFAHPLYMKPDDLRYEEGVAYGRVTSSGTVPYYTRKEIEDGRLLEGKGLELVYVASAFDSFVIHVNGSAEIELADGGKMYIGYKAKTDQPYVSIGGELVKEGKIKKNDLSLAKLRQFFAENPDKINDYLNRNPSYVFFQEYPPGGPFGSLGQPVTPYRSLATDKSIFPRAAPCAVDTQIGTSVGLPEPYVSFGFDQDTGGAIRSAGRCDIYVGIGPLAEKIAGGTKYEGRLFYFFVRDNAPFGKPKN